MLTFTLLATDCGVAFLKLIRISTSAHATNHPQTEGSPDEVRQ